VYVFALAPTIKEPTMHSPRGHLTTSEDPGLQGLRELSSAITPAGSLS
jgi:hypothetical protein